MENLINATLDACRDADQYHGTRTRNSIFNHMMSEIGELGIEVNIVEGQSYKTPGADGIVGEAIDVMLSAIDFIYVTNPSVTAEAFTGSRFATAARNPEDDRNELFCYLSMTAGKTAAIMRLVKINSTYADHVMQDAMAIVYAALDLIKYERPDITDEELLAIAQPKLDKWIQSIRKHAEK